VIALEDGAVVAIEPVQDLPNGRDSGK